MDSNINNQINLFLNAVLAANERVNLTRIVEPSVAQVLHVEDSLAVLPELQAAPEGPYGDLGSGAGFPGVPLALASGRPVVLIESVQKKCLAVEDIVEELELESLVQVYAGRSEDLAHQRAGEFSVLTARALAPLPSLLELASPLLATGGHLICLKGPDFQEELEWAMSLQEKLGMTLLSRRDYTLSDESSRTVFVFEKTGDPKVKLPRRPGAAQTHPYH